MGQHQTKKFLHSKGDHQQNIKTTHRMENIFADTSDKWLISKILQSTYKTQHQKNKQPNYKMCKGPE